MKVLVRLEAVVAIFALQVQAHNLGLHGLSNEDPTGDPLLPEITGAFEVAINIRFIKVEKKYSSIFHWTTTNGQESIYIGYDDDSKNTKLSVTNSGVTTDCYANEDLDKETNYAFRVSVGSTGAAKIFIDNVLHGSCANINFVPANVVRDKHLLGLSDFDGDGDHLALQGHVSGLRITNSGSSQHPAKAYEFWNFPGQSFDKGFVVSFYARFDNLASGTYQAVFDFGNGEARDNLWCGQHANNDRLYCEIYIGTGGTFHEFFSSTGSIVEGEFAFWHIYGDENGSYWIEKDGVQSGVTADLTLPNAVFRRNLLFGHDHWSGDDTMDGVVLGLRLDPLPPS